MVRFLDQQCKDQFGEIMAEIYPLFQKYGVAQPTLRIRDMDTRWGSCLSKKGIITLNKRLLEAPRSCIEYVVMHEFCHFIHPNHSKQFYGFLAMLMPEDVYKRQGMVSPAYIVAEPNDMVDPMFMDYYMKTNRMVHTIHRQSYGVTDFRLRLYWYSFTPIRVALPPVKDQQKIASILSTQEKVIELKEQLLVEKQRQKKYLMQKLLTGKKRLLELDVYKRQFSM